VSSEHSTDSMSRSKRLKVEAPKRYEKTVVKFGKPIYIERWNPRVAKWEYDDVRYMWEGRKAMEERAMELRREKMKNDDE